MTTLDPRTPILVGGGQINQRGGGVEPVDLIVAAARAAAAEAGSNSLLHSIDSVRVIGLLSWKYRDPGALVAARLGAQARHTGYTGNGGSGPQALVHAAAHDIASGRNDVVLIAGAESWRTRMKLRKEGTRPEWTVQGDDVALADILVTDVPMQHESEMRIGLDRPSYVYPLFENAIRRSKGVSDAEHRESIGALWSRFSDVAATNPNAWADRCYSASEIITPSPSNRPIAWPYTKLLNSNNMVEQSAAVLMCSVETAQRFGIPEENWVFPHSGAEAHDTYAIVERPALDESPAIRSAGRRALDLAGISVDDLDMVDLYSCFPSAVQIAATELGLATDDASRPLTRTGGLTFAGGPWNNYSTHAIATLASDLRASPGAWGLLTANSGYLTKHAIGVYSTRPPMHGFRSENVQTEVEAVPTTRGLVEYDGLGTVETYTVVHDRSGEPERGFVSVITESGDRTLAASTRADELELLLGSEPLDSVVRVRRDGSFETM
ncbi:acetyl-CoA acetyltransferase [Rhodococcus sp. 14-2686-1-2]|nr:MULTISPECIES: acetyl-CoA acetyltransferase [unclassified Rhodococcus (in: high G+C Gram-positive bacteria)]OZE90750.1 acetyl-CoA acetyltransferase [Rhodococcus sp. 15-1189-1-1a]OZF07713.1 acetyl-CoA acetyltransferase [Rhodococcus sp. 14-2686-1-2]